jgi:hypothetical protein
MARLIILGCPKGSGTFYNIEKSLRVETCSADKRAVDVGLGHEGGGVFGFHATPVDHANIRTFATELLGE